MRCEMIAPLSLGKGGVKMYNECFDSRPQLGDDEGHGVRHQTADEMHVA